MYPLSLLLYPHTTVVIKKRVGTSYTTVRTSILTLLALIILVQGTGKHVCFPKVLAKDNSVPNEVPDSNNVRSLQQTTEPGPLAYRSDSTAIQRFGLNLNIQPWNAIVVCFYFGKSSHFNSTRLLTNQQNSL